ncbi:MAG: GAF domain-containing protein [Bacteroidota bacterium]
MDFLRNSIKNKLRASFFGLIVLAALGGGISIFYLNKILAYQETKDAFGEIVYLFSEALENESTFLIHERKEEEFLKTKVSPSIQEHQRGFDHIRKTLDKIRDSKLIGELKLQSELLVLRSQLLAHESYFRDLAEAYHIKGFKDYGLEGEMRSYVHQLQDRQNPKEKVFAFSLRRHEKDFMLRKDLKYPERIASTSSEFIDYVNTSGEEHHTEEYKVRTIREIEEYVAQFNKIVEIEKEIGLSKNDGILGKLTESTSAIQPKIALMESKITKSVHRLSQIARVVFVSSIAVLLIVGFLFSALFSSKISKPIIELEGVTKEVLNGNDDVEDKLEAYTSKDEIGSLYRNFSSMLAKIKENLRLVSSKNEELEEKSVEEHKHSWATQGLARFADVIKNNNQDLEKLSYEVVNQLVKYTSSNQGSMYIISENEKNPEMIPMAAYAYNRKKKIKNPVLYGEGLVGASWQERDTIFLSDVPKNYITITSGLGEATPTSVLIVPLKTEEAVMGIIELAAFHVYEEHEVKFVETLSERLASGIQSVRLQERTSRLLGEAQQMAEELKADEEELRQNMEEMQATQEEVSRSHQESTQKLEETSNLLTIYSDLVQSVFKGIILADCNWNIIRINEYTEHLLQFSESDLNRISLNKVFEKEITDILTTMNGSSHGEFSKEIAVNVIASSGKRIAVRSIIRKMKVDENQYIAILFNKYDLTEAKKLVKNLMKKNQFLS